MLFALAAGFASAQDEVPVTTAYQGQSAALSEIAKNIDWDAFRKSVEQRQIDNQMMVPVLPKSLSKAATEDPVRQMFHKSGGTTANIGISFEGTTDLDNAITQGILVVPPDTNGDVGRDHYCQMNNLVFECFDKMTGASVIGPLPNTAFWTGTGSFCEAFNDGDPIVLYDHDADRWVFTQFALFDSSVIPGSFVSHQCFAVSQTDDPTGAYFLYDFIYSAPLFGGLASLNDYPKVTVWPDGYYISVNEFEFFGGFFFIGASAGVVDRNAMLAGAPAGGVKFLVPFTGAAPVHFSLQPSHWESSIDGPPAGRPNTFLQAFDDETWGNGGPDGPDGYWRWDLSADFSTPAFSFVDKGLIPSPNFDSNLCGFGDCIPQPPPATGADVLDTLSQFTMYRASYQNFGVGDPGDAADPNDYEAIVVSHSVDADGADTAGVRWAELRDTGSGYFVHQSGTFAPADGENRWMGAASINNNGDIAIGYSVSSTSTFPSIRVAGRRKNDPLGELGTEVECHAGTGSQIGSANRWGDYSSMSVDPMDHNTFWYTQEYYEDSGSFDFKTRVCSFRLTGSN